MRSVSIAMSLDPDLTLLQRKSLLHKSTSASSEGDCKRISRGKEMTVPLKRVIGKLPAGFAELEAGAKVEGHSHLTRFAAEFTQNPVMFDAIFATYVDDKLAGVGAITDEPTLPSQTEWRMRRLCIAHVIGPLKAQQARVLPLGIAGDRLGHVAVGTLA
jgi:hypothetical protein